MSFQATSGCEARVPSDTRRFANHLEVAQYGVLGLEIPPERFAARGSVRDDPVDRVADVLPKVDRIVFHNETASARTRSRLSPSSVTTSARRPGARSAPRHPSIRSHPAVASGSAECVVAPPAGTDRCRTTPCRTPARPRSIELAKLRMFAVHRALADGDQNSAVADCSAFGSTRSPDRDL